MWLFRDWAAGKQKRHLPLQYLISLSFDNLNKAWIWLGIWLRGRALLGMCKAPGLTPNTANKERNKTCSKKERNHLSSSNDNTRRKTGPESKLAIFLINGTTYSRNRDWTQLEALFALLGGMANGLKLRDPLHLGILPDLGLVDPDTFNRTSQSTLDVN